MDAPVAGVLAAVGGPPGPAPVGALEPLGCSAVVPSFTDEGFFTASNGPGTDAPGIPTPHGDAGNESSQLGQQCSRTPPRLCTAHSASDRHVTACMLGRRLKAPGSDVLPQQFHRR